MEILIIRTTVKCFENKLKSQKKITSKIIYVGTLYSLASQKLTIAQIPPWTFQSHINALGALYLSQEGLLLL